MELSIIVHSKTGASKVLCHWDATGNLNVPKQTPALTDAKVKNLRPTRDQSKQVELSDGGQRGLILRLLPNGQKSWAVRTVLHGKRFFQGIGTYPEVGLSDARQRAQEIISAAHDGIRPEAIETRRKIAQMTVTDAHEEYLTAQRQTLRPSTMVLKDGMWRDHILPVLGKRLLKDIRRADLFEARDSVQAKGFTTQANRVASEVKAFLNWCEEREWIDAAPTARRLKTREKPRERTLSEAELVSLWNLCGSPGDLGRDFTHLLILTGQRRDEVRNMQWSELNLETGLWTIPPERYKTGRTQVVPLSSAVLLILQRRQQQGTSGYVLAGRKEGCPYNAHASTLKRIRARIGDGADFTWHDVRRTVRTGLSRLGIDQATAEMVIGHAPQGLLKVYDQHDRLEEKREALSRWADYVAGLLGERGNNVTPLRKA